MCIIMRSHAAGTARDLRSRRRSLQEERQMKLRIQTIFAASLLVTGFALSGCKSEAQKEVDQQAKAIDKSYEAQADLKEAVAAGAPNAVQAAAHNQAEALRNEGDATRKHLEKEAKQDLPKK
jgi:hypothetical protein